MVSKLRLLRRLTVSLACAVLLAGASAFAVEYSLHVDIRDLVKYRPAENRLLALIVARIDQDPNAFVNDRISNRTLTARERAFNKKPVQIYGIERVKPRSVSAETGEMTETLRVFYKAARGEWLYKTIEVVLRKDAATGAGEILSVRESAEIRPVAAENTKFEVRLGVEERRLIVEDESNGIKKIYAVAAGNKSGNVNGRSKSEALIGKQCFLGAEGFMHEFYNYGASACRVEVNGGFSRYLCHGPVENELTRGWVSLGCIRMRTKDANELYEIIRTSKDKASFEVFKRLKGEDLLFDHPYPLSSIASQKG